MSDKFYSKFIPSAKTSKKGVKESRKDYKKEDRKETSKKSDSFKKSATPKKTFYNDNYKDNADANAQVMSSSPLFKKVDIKLIDNFDEIVQGVMPLNSRQLLQLPDNIRNLSHQMTDERSTRRLGYMNDKLQLSAYIRYFTWWNLVRLTRLFSSLDEKCFPSDNAVCLDLGSGPLTVVTALWLARPDLRQKELTWYCLDVSQNSLAAGEDIFLSVAARLPGKTWKIIRVKGSFGTFIKQKADFITCANMFNEIEQQGDMPPEYQNKKDFEQLINYAKPDTKFLLIEPGVPKAARTLTQFRERFIKQGYHIYSPCPHSEACPMDGFKAYTGSSHKWCNFAFTTTDAPKKLQTLSINAKLPKERAVLSFISAVPEDLVVSTKIDSNLKTLRIVSDGFNLPYHRTGFYACSSFGLTLLSVSSEEAQNYNSGDLLEVKIKTPDSALKTDEKSGAVIIRLL